MAINSPHRLRASRRAHKIFLRLLIFQTGARISTKYLGQCIRTGTSRRRSPVLVATASGINLFSDCHIFHPGLRKQIRRFIRAAISNF